MWWSEPEPGSIAPSYAAVCCSQCGATNGLTLVGDLFLCRDKSMCQRYVTRAKERRKQRSLDLRTLGELVKELNP